MWDSVYVFINRNKTLFYEFHLRSCWHCLFWPFWEKISSITPKTLHSFAHILSNSKIREINKLDIWSCKASIFLLLYIKSLKLLNALAVNRTKIQTSTHPVSPPPPPQQKIWFCFLSELFYRWLLQAPTLKSLDIHVTSFFNISY